MAGINVLLTGGAGFIGSHIADEIVETTDWNVVVMDRLTYAGRLDRLSHLPSGRVRVVHHDFSFPITDRLLKEIGPIEYVLHNGAESHVVRSFSNPEPFILSNVIGTFNILEMCRRIAATKIIVISTDEIFGPSEGQDFKEDDRMRPSNVYSATKAGAEMIAAAWHRSYGLPIIRTRTMNIFGPKQHPEKFVPMTVRKLLTGEMVDIHTNSEGQTGSRHWLHARVQANALLFLLKHGEPGETYHIGGTRLTNFEMAMEIALILARPLSYRKVNAYEQFPGHDLHYGINDDKIISLGWSPQVDFERALKDTVQWYANNRSWLGL